MYIGAYKMTISFKEPNSDYMIAVVGLGYVGLPLAVQLSKHFCRMVGFDVNQNRIRQLNNGMDTNIDVSSEELYNVSERILFTANPEELEQCNFIIVAVPTPITSGNKPDLSYIESSACVVGEHLAKGSTVVFESTVYPGVTEEFCVPIIERCSGLKCGKDWFVGYSPERVNPADKINTIDKITKVVSGMDEATLNKIDLVYSSFTTTHRAPTIKVAEAAKVIENSQRDLNIAFVNELALIFDKLGIDTLDVLEAAGTKWNFLPFKPGLVGGHCISVDPFYLTYKAEDSGVVSQVILAGRRVNDQMPHHVVELLMRGLNQEGKAVKNSKILILGATFKENCPDVRNSKVENIVKELIEMGADVAVHDPFYADQKIPFSEVDITGASNLKKALTGWARKDAIILAVGHKEYEHLTASYIHDTAPIRRAKTVIVDIKGSLGKEEGVIRL
jgi:UDP-N-acetyl-D-galactosamine dehydrogenase